MLFWTLLNCKVNILTTNTFVANSADLSKRKLQFYLHMRFLKEVFVNLPILLGGVGGRDCEINIKQY